MVLLLSSVLGCQRTHPLDVRVKAETPYEFLEWQEEYAQRQPQSVVFELKESVARIVATSPSKMSLTDSAMLHSKYHPICRQLHGRTVRDVMIAGYSAVNQELLRGMVLDSDNLLVTLKHQESIEASPNGTRRLERLVDRRSAMLGTAKAQVEANTRRIAELRKTPSPDEGGNSVRLWVWRVLLHILI